MKSFFSLFITVFILVHTGCHSQNKVEIQNEKSALLCNPEKGFCEIPGTDTNSADNNRALKTTKPLKIIYYTDPICSACWGIEPQLRKLKLEYGHITEIEYRMGGLLPDWSYNSGDISKPSDVARHWDEVSDYYEMPIDGNVWLEDPLESSYPPSVAFKAAQIQDKEKAIRFLRELREMVFLQKKNITKWEHLELAGKKAGLDVAKLKADYERKATELFEEDLKLGRELGIRGFPTLILINSAGQKERAYGTIPYNQLEGTLKKLLPRATKTNYEKTWSYVFSKYPTLTAKEFSELTGNPVKDSEKLLDGLVAKGNLEKMTIRNGSIWIRKNTSR